jgi:tetratricopeptide (TPR) repeat protein
VGRSYEVLGDRRAAAPYLDRAAAIHGPSIMPLANGEEAELALFRWGDDPYRLDAGVAKIRKFLAGNTFAEAVTATKLLSERHGGSVDYQTLAGDVALALGDPEAALGNYRNAAKIRRSSSLVERMVAALQMLGRNGEARSLALDFLAQHPLDRGAAELAAYLAAEAGDWRQARVLFEHVRDLESSGRNPQLFAMLALANLRLGDVDAARKAAEAAYGMQRGNARAAYVLALSLRHSRGRDAEARALLAKARRLGAMNDPLLKGL